MNKDKFIAVVRAMLRENDVRPSSFKLNALNDLGRQIDTDKIDASQAIEGVRSLFSEEYDLLGNRRVWEELKRKLK